jgi:hypothetical protein
LVLWVIAGCAAFLLVAAILTTYEYISTHTRRQLRR